MDLLYVILVGAGAGWLAGFLLKGGGFGAIGNIVVGILGGFVGRLVLPLIGLQIGGGIVGHVLNGAIGAVILIFGIGFIANATKKS